VAVTALVACSAVVHVVVVRSFAVPWIAPDEMVYGLIGRSFWHTGRFALLNGRAPFYGFYPVLAGLPPALFGTVAGITVLQAVQAVLASSAAAIVYAWARLPAGPRWAFVAATLAALLPALVYSGLMMTESVFLATATLALWLLARALEQPTRWRQIVVVAALVPAIATRIQGVVLIPVLLTAIALAAWFARDLGLVRRCTPMFLALGLLAVAWIGLHAAASGSLSSPLGAYRVAAGEGYDLGEAARWVFRHAGDLFLLVIGAPLIAMLLLGWEAACGRERDPAVRSLVAVALASSAWLVVQVGVFASRYVGQLAERDLVVAVPPILACFAVWLSRGLPRPQPATSFVAALVAVPAVLLPVRVLVTPAAAPDAFMTIPLSRILDRTSPGTLEAIWLAVAAGVIVLTVLLPRRAAAVLPAVVAAALAASSVVTVHEVGERSRFDRTSFFGTASRSWVDEASTGPVTYFYDGNAFWNAVWQTVYWNDSIRVIAKLPDTSPGGLPATTVGPRFDGRLFGVAGRSMAGHEVVASTAFTFVGTAVAEARQQNIDQAGLRLWRLTGPPRLSTWTTGLQPNGDIVQPVQISVYACGPGRLELTLLGKQGLPVEVDVDGIPRRRIQLQPGGVWQGAVPAPGYADGQTRCVYELRSPGLVGSTRIEFVRDQATTR
jgi:Dolichyl-phosphate-mannose-protein mannosyltransferase